MIYIFVLLLLFVCAIYSNMSNKRTQSLKAAYWFVCILLIFITGFRDGLGGDTKNYVSVWNTLPDILNIDKNYINSSRFQSGFLYFFSTIRYLTNDYIIFQVIHGIIINVSICWFIRKYAFAPFISLIIYFILNYFEFNMEIVRESIAVCLGLIAYDYYNRKKWTYAIFASIIAFCFHVSAIILILMPLCLIVKYHKGLIKYYLGMILLIFVIFPLIPDMTLYLSYIVKDADNLLSQYGAKEVNQTYNVYYFIALTVKCVIIPIFAITILKSDSNKVLGAALIYLALYSMSAFSYGFYRFANYFALFYTIMLADATRKFAIKFLPTRIRPGYLLTFIIFVLYLYQGFQLQHDMNNGGYLYNRYIPYKSVLF